MISTSSQLVKHGMSAMSVCDADARHRPQHTHHAYTALVVTSPHVRPATPCSGVHGAALSRPFAPSLRPARVAAFPSLPNHLSVMCVWCAQLRGAPSLYVCPDSFLSGSCHIHEIGPSVVEQSLSKCGEIASISGGLSLNECNFVKAFSPHFNRIELKCPAPVQSIEWVGRYEMVVLSRRNSLRRPGRRRPPGLGS